MKNFYYVTSINVSNSRVKSMIERMKLVNMMGTMIDVKLRSKLFMSYTETMNDVNADFEKKKEAIYPGEKEPNLFSFSVPNPAIIQHPNDFMATMMQQLNSPVNNWDDNCCNVMFFVDDPIIDEDGGADLAPNAWMFKYEIFFTEDAIELSGNGDFIFSQANVARTAFTSTYH